MEFWKSVHNEIIAGHSAVLLYVHNSAGSSPGRQGFKMLVSSSGVLCGSIGGGPMEHKLVELAKNKLEQGNFSPFVRRQIHRSNIPSEKSGMICSGEQTIGFYFISISDEQTVIELCATKNNILLTLDQDGIHLEESDSSQKERFLLREQGTTWTMKENIQSKCKLHIVGGGHVGLALSTLANLLDFEVHIYDTRPDINTIVENNSAQFHQIPDYSSIGSFIPSGTMNYVVLMSYGFRTDKEALRGLLNKNFKYIGMMGSKEKIKTLFAELKDEDIDSHWLSKVHAPIGMQIASKTPMEIAVSVMAEIIRENNL